MRKRKGVSTIDFYKVNLHLKSRAVTPNFSL